MKGRLCVALWTNVLHLFIFHWSWVTHPGSLMDSISSAIQLSMLCNIQKLLIYFCCLYLGLKQWKQFVETHFIFVIFSLPF